MLLLLLIIAFLLYLICKDRGIEGFILNDSELDECETIPGTHKSIAMNDEYYYEINDMKITKYSKMTNMLLKSVNMYGEPRVKHLNSGIVIGKYIYVCNNPDEYNTIEVFDLDMNHKYFIDVVGNTGSLQAIEYYQGRWWGCFVHDGKDAKNTILVEFYAPRVDATESNKVKWTIRNRYFFPKCVYDKLGSGSINGFVFGPNGLLYASMNNSDDIYVMRFYWNTASLAMDHVINAGSSGNIIWNKSRDKCYVYNKNASSKITNVPIVQ